MQHQKELSQSPVEPLSQQMRVDDSLKLRARHEKLLWGRQAGHPVEIQDVRYVNHKITSSCEHAFFAEEKPGFLRKDDILNENSKTY